MAEREHPNATTTAFVDVLGWKCDGGVDDCLGGAGGMFPKSFKVLDAICHSCADKWELV